MELLENGGPGNWRFGAPAPLKLINYAYAWTFGAPADPLIYYCFHLHVSIQSDSPCKVACFITCAALCRKIVQ